MFQLLVSVTETLPTQTVLKKRRDTADLAALITDNISAITSIKRDGCMQDLTLS